MWPPPPTIGGLNVKILFFLQARPVCDHLERKSWLGALESCQMRCQLQSAHRSEWTTPLSFETITILDSVVTFWPCHIQPKTPKTKRQTVTPRLCNPRITILPFLDYSRAASNCNSYFPWRNGGRRRDDQNQFPAKCSAQEHNEATWCNNNNGARHDVVQAPRFSLSGRSLAAAPSHRLEELDSRAAVELVVWRPTTTMSPPVLHLLFFTRSVSFLPVVISLKQQQTCK